MIKLRFIATVALIKSASPRFFQKPNKILHSGLLFFATPLALQKVIFYSAKSLLAEF